MLRNNADFADAHASYFELGLPVVLDLRLHDLQLHLVYDLFHFAL